ncbi:MAG: AAA family ATPase [Armatimonadota bacterium]|nr:AAA family ATPase [Armatimonadota bacterium]
MESVIRALRAALQTDPGDVEVRMHLAQLLQDAGQYAEALAEYRAVLRYQPQHPDAWLGVARNLHALGREQEAYHELQALLEQYPDLIEAHLLRERWGLADSEVADVEEPLSSEDETPFPLSQPSVSFADIGGMEEVKEEIRLMVLYPLQHPEIYQTYGRQMGGGVLLYGPPGCGKTLLAKATAAESGLPLLYVAVSDVLSPWFGESERTLHLVFETARRHAPCVLFIDEVDAIGVKRYDAHVVARPLVSQFLEETDGIRSERASVLLLAATNAPWHVDPALLRPGRFDRVLFVPPPDQRARTEILRIHLRDKPVEPRFDYERVAAALHLFSGADIRGLCERAADEAIAQAMRTGQVVPLRTESFLRLAKTVPPSTSEWLRTARNYATYANTSGLYNPVLQWMERERVR